MADPELPLDPDVDDVSTSAAHPLPLHLSPLNVALVALGGAVGTGLRYGIGSRVPHWYGVPVATLGINLLGAFVLGLLLEALIDHGHQVRWARRLRLGLGTGLLGGFTTYSALATDTAILTGQHAGLAIGYASATVLVGAPASMAGIWMARVWLRPVLAGRGVR